MTLGSRYLLIGASRALRKAARERRKVLEAELAAYSSPADRADFEAMLDRYPAGQTQEIRSILYWHDIKPRHQPMIRSPHD